ncbi:Uncharacterised protein [Neisseria meningitidis]|nr:Uncharacterised protein [Neisseria meningitidis]
MYSGLNLNQYSVPGFNILNRIGLFLTEKIIVFSLANN